MSSPVILELHVTMYSGMCELSIKICHSNNIRQSTVCFNLKFKKNICIWVDSELRAVAIATLLHGRNSIWPGQYSNHNNHNIYRRVRERERGEKTEKVGRPPHCNISFVVSTVEEEITLEAIYPRPSKPLISVVASTVAEDCISLEKLGSSWISNKDIIQKKKLHFRSGCGKNCVHCKNIGFCFFWQNFWQFQTHTLT